jgi:hypothetical protein
MYWFKYLRAFVALLTCTLGLAACRPDVQVSTGSKRYFDLKAFITADTARLNKLRPEVTKSVKHNTDKAEEKRITIHNWGRELDLFLASDINKPAWRDSYKIQNAGDSVVYTALFPQLVTRRIAIQKINGVVKKITVNNFTKNLLYQTTEHLVYYPDSLYVIDKLQKVKIIGSNRYLITGKIK